MKRFMKRYGCWNPKYLSNTIEVAEKCSKFKIKKREIHLPEVSIPSDQTEAQVFKKLCLEGFDTKFRDGIIEYHKMPYIKNWPVYYKRFKEEYKIIKRKKFIRYFLIIKELVDWCKENNIMIGPRGSVGGSLIAYLLGITSIDPIKFDLIFGRFINEDRIDYPDIDIDFERHKRHLVRKHLEDMYMDPFCQVASE